MDFVELLEIFDVEYGNQFDANKMEFIKDGEINFISRDSKNNGCVGTVEKYKNIEPHQEGLITVSLGGSFLLSSFLQPKIFYTAQNVSVLKPKTDMTISELIYYCKCISINRFKYSAFGREANKTLKYLKVPSSPPEWVNTLEVPDYSELLKPVSTKQISFTEREWKEFKYETLFDIKKGERITNIEMRVGKTPCIRPIKTNNGVVTYIDLPPNHPGNTITINYNGSVGEAFYQPKPFFALDDINVLYPKFELDVFIAMFLVTLIPLEKFRFSYGRKWNLERMKKSLIKLPVTDDEKPDWGFIRSYIKSIKNSKTL